MLKKRFIFTVTSGRTGTAYLSHLMGIFPHTDTFHEPAPSYNLVLRDVQSNPGLAHKFLVEQKIPAICASSAAPIYIETSHLFCTGFLEPWLEIAPLPVPDLILLTRDPREVAISFLRIDSIPGRTAPGLSFMLAPSDPGCFTQVEAWEKLTDYQLCYWYCLEIAERRERYRQLIESKGGRVVSTSVSRLQTLPGLLEIQKGLNLPALAPRGWLGYLKRRRERINQKKSKRPVVLSPDEMTALEEAVRQNTHPKNQPFER